MTAAGERRQSLEPLPAPLLRVPLDYILACHHRQRVLCHLCDRLAESDVADPETALMVVGHIEMELAAHIADEENDLFPLLRRRAKPEDNIAPVLERLAADHAEDQRLARRIVSGLRRLAGEPGRPPSTALRNALRAFARNERRHLAIENAIVIPLAKVRLSAKDKAGLAGRMAARRNTKPGS